MMDQHDFEVLLVEDDDDDALIMGKLLSRLGKSVNHYRVVRAPSLEKSLELLTQKHFDLILLDLQLPDSRGLDTLRRLQPSAAGVPIVVCSGITDENIAADAVAGGAQDYMMKDQMSPELFERVLRYALERRKIQELREEFMGMVVHELRSPLTVSIEGLRQILEGILGTVSEDQRFFLDMVLKNMERLNLLINDLLDLTKIEIGKMKLKKTSFNMAALAQEVCASFKQSIASRGLELQQVYPDPGILVEADREKISQVFINLLSNALKFTPQGTIRVGIEDRGGAIECSVSDTGAGIPEEGLEKLFNKFEQFGHTPAGGEKGTGLGLAICKGIMTAHGGSIRVESKAGKGSKFIFSLPKVHMPVT